MPNKRSKAAVQQLNRLLEEVNDLFQLLWILQAGDFMTVVLEHQCISLVAHHFELLHESGFAISSVKVYDNELFGQLRERPVRVRVLLENPAMFAS